MSGDPDPDGLPLFPPLPGGPTAQVRPRSVARLVGLRTGVLTVRTEAVAAMVVLLDREPVDGLAVRGDRRVVGPEALDEIEDVPLDQITVTEVAPELARELGSYFLPSELGSLPVNVVVAEGFVRSLARPGRRGCIAVRAAGTLGLVFLAGGRIALAYREGGVLGGLEQVAPLLADPGATLWARLGPDRREGAPVPEAPAPPEPIPQPPEPAPPPAPPEPAASPGRGTPRVPDTAPAIVASPQLYSEPDAFMSELDDFALPDPAPLEVVAPEAPMLPEPLESPAAVAPTAESAPASRLGAPATSPLDVVVEEVRAVVGPHAARIESVLSRADPSVEGLQAAVESLRARRLRLFSPATMDLIADRAAGALERHAAGRADPET